MELAPFGVEVVVIQPGTIRTEWSGSASAMLLTASGVTAYAEQARLVASTLERANHDSGAPPAVVGHAVWAALTARRPKTRYAVGGGASLLLRLRRLLGDRALDAVLHTVVARMESAGSNT